jgi:hypothetical protein
MFRLAKINGFAYLKIQMRNQALLRRRGKEAGGLGGETPHRPFAHAS